MERHTGRYYSKSLGKLVFVEPVESGKLIIPRHSDGEGTEFEWSDLIRVEPVWAMKIQCPSVEANATMDKMIWTAREYGFQVSDMMEIHFGRGFVSLEVWKQEY